MGTDLQRRPIIRTTDLVPEAVIPPPSRAGIPWGPMIVGLLIVVTMGVALAWSVGLAGLKDDPAAIRKASATAPVVTVARSPYPTELPDLSGREARIASAGSVAPLPPVPETEPIAPPPMIEIAPAPRPAPAPRVERIKPIVSVVAAVTSRAVAAPKLKQVAEAVPKPPRAAVVATEVVARHAQPLGGPLAGVFVLRDYPAAALHNGEHGDVTVRLAVSRDGRATRCAILAADASPLLVGATCAILLQRARFDPAMSSAGLATEGFFVQHVAWRLP